MHAFVVNVKIYLQVNTLYDHKELIVNTVFTPIKVTTSNYFSLTAYIQTCFVSFYKSYTYGCNFANQSTNLWLISRCLSVRFGKLTSNSF